MINDLDEMAIRGKIRELKNALQYFENTEYGGDPLPIIPHILSKLEDLLKPECSNYEDCLHNNMALGCAESHRKEVRRCPYISYHDPPIRKSRRNKVKCPVEGCSFEESEEMVKIHLELYHGYMSSSAENAIREKILRGDKYR